MNVTITENYNIIQNIKLIKVYNSNKMCPHFRFTRLVFSQFASLFLCSVWLVICFVFFLLLQLYDCLDVCGCNFNTKSKIKFSVFSVHSFSCYTLVKRAAIMTFWSSVDTHIKLTFLINNTYKTGHLQLW